MTTMPCQTCGSPVDLSTVSASDRPKRMYCSRSCSTRMNNVLYPKRGTRMEVVVPSKNPDGTISECLKCRESIHLSYNSLFCTDDCRTSFWDLYNNTRIVNNKNTKPKVYKKKKCPDCDTMIHMGSGACRRHKRIREGIPYRGRTIELWLSGEWDGSISEGTPDTISPIIREYLYKECNYGCTICGFDKVHPTDGRIILQVDHIDGDATNHSPSNVRVLCPNCHAMTPTYGRRNKKSTRTRRKTSNIRGT